MRLFLHDGGVVSITPAPRSYSTSGVGLRRGYSTSGSSHSTGGEAQAGTGASNASLRPTAPRSAPVTQRRHFIQVGRVRRKIAMAPAANVPASETIPARQPWLRLRRAQV